MFSEKQIKEMISAGAQSEIAEALEGDISIGGDLEVAGDAKLFENIVDAQGHKRFIEGDIDLLEDATEYTKTYGKWSLSGTHLMIVLGIDVANGTTTTHNTLAILSLPQWVKDKIYVLYGSATVLAHQATGYGDDYTSQQVSSAINKRADGKVEIYLASFTASANRHFRIAFDLLIDNEQGQ